MVEFQEIAAEVLEAAFNYDQQKIQDNQPIFSYDNPTVHLGGDAVVGPQGSPFRAPLPPYSPDMHKVIEHVFNTSSQILKVEVFPAVIANGRNHPSGGYSVDVWPKVVEGTVRAIPLSSIQNDVRSLPDTYRYVIDHGGDWVPRPDN